MHVLSGARDFFFFLHLFRLIVHAALDGNKLRHCITHTERHTCVYTYAATSGAADCQGHVCLYSLTSITALRH